MATPEEIAAITDETAAGPKSAAVDGNSVNSHPIPDLLALEKQRAANAQAVSVQGLFKKISPPGAA